LFIKLLHRAKTSDSYTIRLSNNHKKIWQDQEQHEVLQLKKLPVQEKEMQNLRQKQEKDLHEEEKVQLEEELPEG